MSGEHKAYSLSLVQVIGCFLMLIRYLMLSYRELEHLSGQCQTKSTYSIQLNAFEMYLSGIKLGKFDALKK